MTATLEVRHILNVNAAWARSNLGPLAELKKDIAANGIQTPVLLKPDFHMIDGARRVVVAKSLGYKEVPVVVCRSWYDIRAHFNPIAPGCYPMDWPDLISFWYEVLNPFHLVIQRNDAMKTRKSGKASTKRDTYSGFIRELADIYQSNPSTIKTLRDYVNRIQARMATYPEYMSGVLESLPKGWEAGDLRKANSLKTTMERLMAGDLSQEDALNLLQRRFRGDPSSRSRRQPTITVSNDYPERSYDSLLAFIEMIESLASESAGFHRFNIKPDDADVMVFRLRTAVASITRMRKRLQLVLSPGEGKEPG